MMAVGRNVRILTGSCMATLVLSVGGLAKADNALPYTESFEELAVGSQIASTNGVDGWYGDSNACTVVADTSSFTWGYPIPSATHTNVLNLEAPVTNRFSYSWPGISNVWIDLMVKPVPRENPPAVLPSDVQVAMYMGANGKMNIFHARHLSSGNPTQMWSELDYSLSTGEWLRVTLEMDYLKDNWGGGTDKYFRISFNGGSPISNANAYSELPITAYEPDNGTYFLIACGGSGAGNPGLTSLSTEGPGMIDDVVVTTDKNDLAGQSTSIHGVPLAWFQSMGISDPDGDADGDGIDNWAEWVAGTDPMTGDVFLEIVRAGKGLLSLGGASSPNADAVFTILRNANLTDPIENWTVVASGLTNVTGPWQDPSAPNGKAYYRARMHWNQY